MYSKSPPHAHHRSQERPGPQFLRLFYAASRGPCARLLLKKLMRDGLNVPRERAQSCFDPKRRNGQKRHRKHRPPEIAA